MKINPELEFQRELGVFGAEVNEVIQSFYAEQAIHNAARNSRALFDILNRHAPFWNLTTRALQSNTLIALGRVFDNDSQSHSVFRLLQIATAHPEIFSRAALEQRKRPQARQWTEEFMRTAYVPTAGDFARLTRYAENQKGVYRDEYRILRNKYFAHRDRSDISGRFAAASIPRLERLLIFLRQLHDALWDLFNNGRRPTFRPARRSARRIIKLPERAFRNRDEQEWITLETRRFLEMVFVNSKLRVEERHI